VLGETVFNAVSHGARSGPELPVREIRIRSYHYFLPGLMIPFLEKESEAGFAALRETMMTW
jgi:hypothetical protein